MAITTSAKKAHRAGLRKKAFNDARKKNLSLALKMKRGLMTKNTAARRKAKVAKALATSH